MTLATERDDLGDGREDLGDGREDLGHRREDLGHRREEGQVERCPQLPTGPRVELPNRAVEIKGF